MNITRSCTTLLLSLAALSSAVAGSLIVTVTGADGKPVADTVVMLRRAGGFQAFDVREVPVVSQKDIRFSPYVTVVPPRGMVRFVNQDRFDHHVRSMPSGPMGSVPPSQDFEFRLPAARGNNQSSADLKIETAGAIVLGCHLHGSMRAHIFVTPTPWYALTDAKGQARIENVPDGVGEIRLWHPDQLSEQAAVQTQVAGNVTADARLNFSPRPRAPARAKTEYEN